jgi:hypothetical protein
VLNSHLTCANYTVVVANLLVGPLLPACPVGRSRGRLRDYDEDAVPVARCEMVVLMDL